MLKEHSFPLLVNSYSQDRKLNLGEYALIGGGGGLIYLEAEFMRDESCISDWNDLPIGMIYLLKDLPFTH